jgi:hypothetical protein
LSDEPHAAPPAGAATEVAVGKGKYPITSDTNTIHRQIPVMIEASKGEITQ